MPTNVVICYRKEGSYNPKTGSEPPVAVFLTQGEADTYIAANVDPARHTPTILSIPLTAP